MLFFSNLLNFMKYSDEQRYFEALKRDVQEVQWSFVGTVQPNTNKRITSYSYHKVYDFGKAVMFKVANHFHGRPEYFITPVIAGSMHVHFLLKVSGKRRRRYKECDLKIDGSKWEHDDLLMCPFHDQKLQFGFAGATIRVEPYDREKGAFDCYALNQNDRSHSLKYLDRSWLFYNSKINYMFSPYIKKT